MPTPERKEPQLLESEFYINRAWRRLGEELGPYVAGKINDDSLKETRDVSTILSKMLERGPLEGGLRKRGIWDSYFQAELDHDGRGLVNQLRKFRNAWAHQSLEGYNDNDVLQNLYRIVELLRAISAPAQADSVQQMYDKLLPLIGALGTPVRQQPTNVYAELLQQFQKLETERRQLSELLIPHPSAQPEIPPLAPATPPSPAPQPNITTPASAAPANTDTTTPFDLNIRQPEYFVNLGNAAFDESDFDQSIYYYSQALELSPNISAEMNPSLVVAYNNRGKAYARKGEYDQAIADFSKTLELNPEYADAYYNRGNVYGNKREYDQAIADFSKALELNPDDVDAYNSRGISYAGKREYDQAIADFSKVLELNPDDATVFYNNRGAAYAAKREYDQAMSDCSKALELNPDNAAAYALRGNVYADKGEYDQAIADFAKALELNPDNAVAYALRGNVYADKGEYGQAIADYTKAPGTRPGHCARSLRQPWHRLP